MRHQSTVMITQTSAHVNAIILVTVYLENAPLPPTDPAPTVASIDNMFMDHCRLRFRDIWKRRFSK